ncbi:MAG: hypothetical protein ABR499_15905 [Gemmatimonadaceae bacterium]
MRHAIRFEGGFERNFATLRSGTGDYEGDDGSRRAVAPWPAEADGVRFGFMEQQGKRFVAVRVWYGDEEIVLRHPVRLDPGRHLGGRRFSPRPIPLGDEPAGALLADILDLNPEQRPELTALRERVRRALAHPQSV